MKKLGIVIIVFALSFLPILTSAKNKWVAPNAELAKPTGTYEFVKRDTANLMLDFYKPTEGSVTEVNGKVKPAIVFAFGGGFVSGHRDKEHYQQWIKLLNDNGFAVFSIDYRLGLKGAKMGGIKTIGAVRHAINVGVEDMFSATCYIVTSALTRTILSWPGLRLVRSSRFSRSTNFAIARNWLLCFLRDSNILV